MCPSRAATFAALLFVLAASEAFLRRRTPAPLLSALGHIGLVQGWGMFERGILRDEYWSGEAHRRDGTTLDPLRTLAPAMLPQASAHFSRWYKLRDNMIEDARLRVLLLDWLCRQAPLADDALVLWDRPVHAPGEPPRPFGRADETRWRCRPR
jgi:hypothetical protein